MSRTSFYGFCVGAVGIALVISYLGYLFLDVPLFAIPLWGLPTLLAVIKGSVDFGRA